MSFQEVQQIHEILGKHYSSVQNMVAVNSMVSQAILRSGTVQHKDKYLKGLVSGDLIGAFALTEPNIGSDVYSIEDTRIGIEY